MDWETYWASLLKKKLGAKVKEMNQADIARGNTQTIEDICHQIYLDYLDWCNKLQEIKKDLVEELGNLNGVHLQCNRVKALDSLLEKVINKRYANLMNADSEYYHINGENYKSIITDLIGMRFIINYRGKWTVIHNELLEIFPYATNETYAKGCLLPHPKDGRNIQIEIPKAYYAPGDDINTFREYGLDVRLHEKGYRSIHYTVSYKGVYIELQLRTIYDEAWSDCDHNYVYKKDDNKSHTALAQISDVLCKLTNVSNDIGERMKEIFEKDPVIEVSGNSWETSRENLEVFEEALTRIKEAYDSLEKFQQRLIARE